MPDIGGGGAESGKGMGIDLPNIKEAPSDRLSAAQVHFENVFGHTQRLYSRPENIICRLFWLVQAKGACTCQ